ncbi:MAG: LptA/OstA family protein, partial [Pseudomonadota bacterium]
MVLRRFQVGLLLAVFMLLGQLLALAAPPTPEDKTPVKAEKDKKPDSAKPAPSREKPEPGSPLGADKKKGPEEPPINITADNMEAKDKDKVVIFTGSVVARREDVVLNCDLMRVYYREIGPTEDKQAKKPKPGAEPDDGERPETEIDRVECDGNVKITRGDRVALAKKAVFLAKANPRVI